MPKLVKNYYYGKDGVKKLNGYLIHLSKEEVEKANIDTTKDIEKYVENNKIIIKEKEGK